MKQALRIALVSALATAAAIKGVPALAAAEASNVNVSVVRTADLDLRSVAGQRALHQRLAIAASEVCGPVSAADLPGKNAVRKCRHEVLAAARARSAELTTQRNAMRIVVVAAAR